jgi:hypothetical protein
VDRFGGASQVLLERIKPRRPLRPIRLQPRVELHQRFWTESVEPPLRILPDLLQPGLLENPSIEVVLGMSLQLARQALESLDHEALAALGLGAGTDAPALPMRVVPKKPRLRDVAQKDRVRMAPAAKKVLEDASKPNRRKLQITAQ